MIERVNDSKYTKANGEARVRQFLDMTITRAGFDLKYAISSGEVPHPDFENPDFLVRFSGPDVELLLANKAELLLAMEQLTMEAIGMTSDEHARLCFDANDHRILRIQELRMSAQAAAEIVRKNHQPFHFSPMNSRERRLLHLALRDEKEVRSESVGEGFIRQVVIVPADMTTLPEPIRPPRPRPEDDAPRSRFGRSGPGGGRGGERRSGPGGGRGGPRDRGPRR
ncbi:MAG: R3H domain-containing nucleic acid-binding protein [Acidobacteriota bacterium]